MKLRFIKTFLFLILNIVTAQSFALDPNQDYKKISSEHFDIIYDAKSYELAKMYLEEAERSYLILKDVFGITPDKTVVVLDDTVDTANGSATGVPRPSVTIYVNPPTPLSTVDHFSSWPRDVFLHEYAHVLNMEPARGIMKPFRFIFGSFVRPNMYLPRWYLEGLAVEMESRFNEFGRLKSQDYDALIRSLYLDNLWGTETLSSINEVATPSWPQGQRPYFYGALIWHELIQSKSISVVKTFNERYARRIPWFISQPMVDELGQTYQNFLDTVFTKYGELARAQVQKIQEQPVTSGKLILTKEGVYNHSPEISPDGEKLLFISQNLNKESVLYVFKKLDKTWIPVEAVQPEDEPEPLKDVSKKEIQKATWFPSSQKIVFDSVGPYRHWNHYYDLFTFDLGTKKTTQITKGLRAREPSVSPDGKAIVFIKSGQGKTLLSQIAADGSNEQILYDPNNYERVSRPSFLNEKEIVFVQKKDGVDKLHIFNLETKSVSRILDMQGQFPSVTPAGIVFSSSKSGVKNLYITTNDFTAVKPLTSSLTKVLNGTFDAKSNSIIYSELSGNGQQIKEAAVSETPLIVPPVIHPIANDYQEQIKDKPTLNPTEEDYSALPYMFPQFWFPFLNFVDGGTIASVAIPGSDPTGFHSYLLSGTYDSRPEKFSGYFAYQYVNPFGATSLAAGNFYQWYSSLERATSSQQAVLRHSFFITKAATQAYVGYEYKKSNIFESISGVSQSRNHYFDGPMVGLTFTSMNKKAMDISPSGQLASVRYTHYFENTTDTDFHETFVKLSHFHKKWLPNRHVLAISAQGSFTPKNRSLILGTTTTDSEYVLGALGSFITRGYPSGEFIGYSIAMGTIEYRFPIQEIWRGPDNPRPYFFKRSHGALYGETLTVDGIYFGKDESSYRAKLGKYFTTVGFDYNIDMTLFYHVPVTVKIGYGYGLETKAQGGSKIYMSIAAPTLF